MKNLKISKKILVAFSIIILLTTLIAASGISSIYKMGNNLNNFYENNHQNTIVAMEIRQSLQSAAKYVGYATMTDDMTLKGKYIDKAQDQLDFMRQNIQYLYDNYSNDITLVENLEKTMLDSIEHKEIVFESARKNENAIAIDEFFNGYEQHLDEASDYLTQINDSVQTNAEEVYVSMNKLQNFTLCYLTILVIACFAIMFLLVSYLTNSINKPLKEIEGMAKEMANGSLKSTVTYKSKDELGSLADSMRTLTSGISSIIEDISYVLSAMAEGNFTVRTRIEDSYIGDYNPILGSMRTIKHRLCDSLTQINGVAEQVNSGSEQVSYGAQSLSQGATEQASSIEELSATISEISTQISDNAENAKYASMMSLEAGEGILESNEKMQHMISAMNEISNTSAEIGKIIKTIDDIAFQTNILALNAAVEAARAGSAGKGFAVVADEVRNLAQKSAEAAKNTTTLLEGTLTAIESGTEIADQTAKALLEVVQKANSVNENMKNITVASEQQANAVAQVGQGVEQISTVVQTNSATAEESAAESEELRSQAQTLKNLVGRFILE